MPECPGNTRRDNLATRPNVAILDTVAGTLNRFLALHIDRDGCPFVATVGTEVNRSVRDRVLVVGYDSGVLIGTDDSTERTLIVRSNDVFRG